MQMGGAEAESEEEAEKKLLRNSTESLLYF